MAVAAPCGPSATRRPPSWPLFHLLEKPSGILGLIFRGVCQTLPTPVPSKHNLIGTHPQLRVDLVMVDLEHLWNGLDPIEVLLQM